MSLAPKVSEPLAARGTTGPGCARPPAVVLDAVSKRYGSATVVQSVTLTVEEGEFFSLLGPSGCGKTTLLRMLAGFVVPDEGRILLRGDDVGGRPPNRRDLNMVFQNYQLFPHMTVAENVAYGLKMRKIPKPERHDRVAEMLGLLGVSALAQRRTSQLSGGQQQRVALARALVNRPAVLLLDEPLSALDAKLRKRMQEEMKSVQHKLGTTFVYVTHDQDEAMRMSDRIGIMRGGVLLQVATPREIYERPAERFVADFVGRLNELSVTVECVRADRVECRCGDGGLLAFRAETAHTPGDEVRLAVRPERIAITDADGDVGPGPGTSLSGTVTDVVHLGPVTDVAVAVAGLGSVMVQTLTGSAAGRLSAEDRVRISWPLEAAFVLHD